MLRRIVLRRLGGRWYNRFTAPSRLLSKCLRRTSRCAEDIILGIEGHDHRMTMLQFNAWVRLTLNVGDRIVYNVIRDGKRMQIPMTLAERD